MFILISLPEIAYVKSGGGIFLCVWEPPAGMFFKFCVKEYGNDVLLDEMKMDLLVADAPIYLSRAEILDYRRRYG
jgi:hypothetical protein